MASEADLRRCKVLVAEDDDFMAEDIERALREAGATVLGPVSSEHGALILLADEAPSCALVDLDLGDDAPFGLAEALQDKGVPFVFVTDCDDAKIPARFERVERLRKPVEFRQVVRAAAQMCAA